ncbi:MAG: S-layer homology domain-containing protein [Eggerthellaceae bacterium]|nr:S-layer homology domain-containing protein [Eggerthellaceae bacterium]
MSSLKSAFFRIVLSAVLAVGLLPVAAFAEKEAQFGDTTELQNVLDRGGEVVVSQNYALGKPLVIKSGNSVTLTLNGNIYVTGDWKSNVAANPSDDAAIIVETGASLTISGQGFVGTHEDLGMKYAIKALGSSKESYAIVTVNGGTLRGPTAAIYQEPFAKVTVNGGTQIDGNGSDSGDQGGSGGQGGSIDDSATEITVSSDFELRQALASRVKKTITVASTIQCFDSVSVGNEHVLSIAEGVELRLHGMFDLSGTEGGWTLGVEGPGKLRLMGEDCFKGGFLNLSNNAKVDIESGCTFANVSTTISSGAVLTVGGGRFLLDGGKSIIVDQGGMLDVNYVDSGNYPDLLEGGIVKNGSLVVKDGGTLKLTELGHQSIWLEGFESNLIFGEQAIVEGSGSIYLRTGAYIDVPEGFFSDAGCTYSSYAEGAKKEVLPGTAAPVDNALAEGKYKLTAVVDADGNEGARLLKVSVATEDPKGDDGKPVDNGITTEAELVEALAKGEATLSSDVAISKPLVIDGKAILTLDDHRVVPSTSWSGGSSLVSVKEGGDLTVYGVPETGWGDSMGDYGGVVTSLGDPDIECAIFVEDGGALTVRGGLIEGTSKAIGTTNTANVQLVRGAFSSDVAGLATSGYQIFQNVKGYYETQCTVFVIEGEGDPEPYPYDIQTALNDPANSGKTVWLAVSQGLSEPLTVSQKIRFVLWGSCLYPSKWKGGEALVIVESGGDLQLDGSGTIDARDSEVPSAISVQGSQDGKEGGKLALFSLGAEMALYSDQYAISGVKGDKGTVINVGDGTALYSTPGRGGAAIFHPQDGDLNITGGFIRGDVCIYHCSGALDISGGNIMGTADGIDYDPDVLSESHVCTGDAVIIENRNVGVDSGYTTPVVNISGGSFDGFQWNNMAVASYARTGAPVITGFLTGGSFSEEFPEDYVANGYQRIKNAGGGWGVKAADQMLLNGATFYGSLEDALDTAGKTYTITLKSDFYLTEPLTVDVPVVLDLNGFMVTASGEWDTSKGDSLFEVVPGGSLTVRDSSAEGDGRITNMESVQLIQTAIELHGSASDEVASVTVESGLVQGYSCAIASEAGYGASQITVKGGSIQSYSDQGVAVFNPAGKLSISGGTFRGTTSVWFCGGELSISGGFYSGSLYGAAYNPAATGDGFIATGDAVVVENRGAKLSASISGGYFDSGSAIRSVASYARAGADGGALAEFISGGRFINDVSSLVKPGYRCSRGQNAYTVGPVTAASASSSTITVSVSGSKNAVRVVAKVEGNKAAVENIGQEDIEHAADGSENHDVTIDFSELDGDITEVVLSADSLVRISDVAKEANGVNGLDIKLTGGWGVRFDADALEAIAAATGGSGDVSVKLEENDGTGLTDEQNGVLGQMGETTVVSAIVTVDSGNVSDFQGGYVKVSVPYEVPKNGKYKFTTAWYISEDGKKEPITTTYDEAHKMVCFYVPHFSDYAITSDEANFAHVCPSAALADVVEGAWYHEAVDFVVLENIMGQGTGGRFAPGATTTRAQFVTALWRYAGSPVVKGAEAPAFVDVSEGAYYAKAVAWAVESGITTGYTEGPSAGKFGVADPVTREQMATFLWRFAKAQGIVVSSAVDLSIFVDAGQVGSYAGPAFEWAAASGVISGYTDGSGRLGPKDDATRAQVATVLYRFDNLA